MSVQQGLVEVESNLAPLFSFSVPMPGTELPVVLRLLMSRVRELRPALRRRTSSRGSAWRFAVTTSCWIVTPDWWRQRCIAGVVAPLGDLSKQVTAVNVREASELCLWSLFEQRCGS